MWNHIASVDKLGRIRMHAMNDFLSAYTEAVQGGRYVEASLPTFPGEERACDIAACSHPLFLYSEQLSEDFHFQSIKKLCRVSSEARIFSLLELGEKSRHLEKIIDRLGSFGFAVNIEKAPCEFQKGGKK